MSWGKFKLPFVFLPLLLAFFLCLNGRATSERSHSLLKTFNLRASRLFQNLPKEIEEGWDCNYPDGLTYAEILQDSKKFSTLDEYLVSLKEVDKEFFVAPALVFDSDSSQSEEDHAISETFPRIIATSGPIALGMVGNPSSKGYDELEIQEYIPKSGRYAFHRIVFPGKNTKAVHQNEGGQSCIRCHGINPRPNWMSYSLWSGIYGQFHGSLSFDSEMAKYQKFLEKNKDSFRYGLFRTKGYLHEGFGGELGTERTNYKLSRRNLCSIYTRIKNSSSFWKTYKFAIAGAVSGCYDIKNFFPDAAMKAHENKLKTTIKELYEETEAIAYKDMNRRVKAFLRIMEIDLVPKFFPIAYDAFPGEVNIVNNLRFVVEGQSIDDKLDMKSWSMSYVAGRKNYSYSFSDGDQGIYDLWKYIMGPRSKSDPDFKDVQGCAALAAKSRQALADVTQP